MYWYEKDSLEMTEEDCKLAEKYVHNRPVQYPFPVGEDGIVHWYNKPEKEWTAEDFIWWDYVDEENHWWHSRYFEWNGQKYDLAEFCELFQIVECGAPNAFKSIHLARFHDNMKAAMDTPLLDGLTLREVFRQLKPDDMKDYIKELPGLENALFPKLFEYCEKEFVPGDDSMYWYEKDAFEMREEDDKLAEKYVHLQQGRYPFPVAENGIVHWYNKPKEEWTAEDFIWWKFVGCEKNSWRYLLRFGWMGKRYELTESYELNLLLEDASGQVISSEQLKKFPVMRAAMDTRILNGLTLREVFRQLQADDLEWP